MVMDQPHSKPQPVRLDLLAAACAAILASTTIIVACGGFDVLTGRPIRFRGDAVFHYSLAQAVLDDGWTWHAHRLGAPSGFDFLAFGLNLTLESAVLWLFSFTTDDCIALLNRVWILLCGVSAANAYAAFRLLGLSRVASLVCGCLFATIPYVYYRSVGHFNLQVAFVPIPTAAAVLVLSDSLRGLTRRAWLVVLGSCFLVGLGFIYYAFFTCLLMTYAAVIAWLTGKTGSIRRGLLCLAAVVVGAAMSLTPVAIDWARHGKPAELNDRLPEQADMFALRPRDMIMPDAESPIPGLRELGASIDQVPWPNNTESRFAKLGTFGAIGFLICLVVLAGVRPPGDPSHAVVIRAAASCVLMLVLVGVGGGFGSIFNVLVTPVIRCYNRVLPHLAVLSLLPIGSLLHAAMHSCRRGGIATGLAGAILACGLIEQNTAHKIRSEAPRLREERADLKAFVHAVEHASRPNAAVFMLPPTRFPNDPSNGTMLPYEHAKAFLFSRHLRWSWPIFGAPQQAMLSSVGQASDPEFLRRLRAAGFDYAWIDRRSETAERDEAAVAAGGGRLIQSDRTGRYGFYDLTEAHHAE
jgi:hypothetical protein